MDSITRDIRYALRGLLRTPGFTAAVILTLGLGIGANTTMFGVLDVMMLRPPEHVEQPDRVARVYFRNTYAGYGTFTGTSTRVPLYRALKENGRFAAVAAQFPQRLSLGRGTEARQVQTRVVSHEFFPLLGATTAFGRGFTADDDRVDAPATAVLGHGFWRGHFSGDSTVLGRALPIGRGTYTVIGVAPAGFTGVDLTEPDIWLPLSPAAADVNSVEALTSWNYNWISLVARLADGVTREVAERNATDAVLQAYRAAERRDTLTQVVLGPVQAARAPEMQGDAKVAIWVGGVALMVLLIACANVANLMLARGLGRRRELAVRAGLGASRGELVRLLLAESLLLSACGAAAAIVISAWGGGVVRSLLLRNLPESVSLFDARVFVFTAAIAILAGLLAGLVPALQSSRTDAAGVLRSGGRDVTSIRGRLRASLVVAQVAMTLVLLVGAGLFVRSLRNAQNLDYGMTLDRVLITEPNLRSIGVEQAEADQIQLRLLARIQEHPAVAAAAASVGTPYGWSYSNTMRVSGVDSLPIRDGGGPYYNAVTPDYFTTLGLTVLRGRAFTAADAEGSAPVAMVSQSLAEAGWPGSEAIGGCIYVGGNDSNCVQVIGVVRDARTNGTARQPVPFTWYIPLAQKILTSPISGLVIRTHGPAKDAAVAVRQALQGAEPGLPWLQVQALIDRVSPGWRSWQLGATMITAFGVLALVIASLGLYGVTSYMVNQRTQEIGVRIALGAQRPDVYRLIVGQGMRSAVMGVLLGGAGVYALGRGVSSLLFGVPPADPFVIGSMVVTLLAVSLVAALVPARRAARIHPMEALRAE